MSDRLEEWLAQNIRIEDVIDFYVPLRRGSKSGKTLECKCPFHLDKHNSLKVRKTEQMYECEVCQESGGVLDFVQAIEGCEWYDALEILTDRYQLAVDELKPDETFQSEKSKINVRVPDLNLFSTVHLVREYKMIFEALTPSISIVDILRDTVRLFELSIAPATLPDSYAGLCHKKILPIRNENGELAAFTTHEMKEDGCRSYTGIPYESCEYLLYGLYQAKSSIKQLGFLYLTHDLEDVLVMHATGFCNTIGYYGETLTVQHIEMIKRYTERVILLHNKTIPEQVKGFKTRALLSRNIAETEQVCYNPETNLTDVLIRLGVTDFIQYIRGVTRFSRLRNYETELFARIQDITFELELAQDINERAILLSSLIPIRKKLNKVSNMLNQFPQFQFTGRPMLP